MVTYKGKQVTKEWLLEQLKINTMSLEDFKEVKITKRQPPKPKPEIAKVIKGYPFNFFVEDEDLEGRKLFGCVVRASERGMARISLDVPKPYPDMVEIPIGCVGMEEEEVIEIIRKEYRDATLS